MATRPLRTRRGRSTRRALRAAQSMCTIASRISSWASASGLPVSVCTSSASRPMYRVMCDFQASSRLPLLPVRPAHQAAAWCALDGLATSCFAVDAEGGDDLRGRRVQRVECLRGLCWAVGPGGRCHGLTINSPARFSRRVPSKSPGRGGDTGARGGSSAGPGGYHRDRADQQSSCQPARRAGTRTRMPTGSRQPSSCPAAARRPRRRSRSARAGERRAAPCLPPVTRGSLTRRPRRGGRRWPSARAGRRPGTAAGGRWPAHHVQLAGAVRDPRVPAPLCAELSSRPGSAGWSSPGWSRRSSCPVAVPALRRAGVTVVEIPELAGRPARSTRTSSRDLVRHPGRSARSHAVRGPCAGPPCPARCGFSPRRG